MSTIQLLDVAGRRRSPATLPGFHAGRPPRNKGFRYPPDPPRVEEIVAVMRRAGETDHGLRLRALIVVLWRAGLRVGEAMALTEPDLDPGRGSILVRQGKGGKRREVGMDDWRFDQLQPWLARRLEIPVGTLFCVIDGQTRGRPWTPAAARNHLRRVATKAGVRRRFAPHQLRHTHAVEMAREGVSLKVIQRQLGHVNLGVTSVYLDGIDTAEIIDTVHNRRAPMISASAGLMILPATAAGALAQWESRRLLARAPRTGDIPHLASANLELVRSIFAAWQRGDFSSTEWAHPEIEFMIADGPAPGSYEGLAEMAEGWREFLSAWEDFRAEDVDEYRELDGERVLALQQFSARGKTSGFDLRQMRTRGANLFHVRGGKVIRLVLYWNRERALADLGLAPEAGSQHS